MTALKELACERFGDLVKAVVDVEAGVMAIGGEMHSDEEEVLLSAGSKQENLWGVNLYPDKCEDDFVEFDSVINIRPRQNNRSRGVEDIAIREKIKMIVSNLVD
ncbi:hypothetical protein HY932_02735 [Candidatus Falkowbacteria bacterium]|nr:hypothetical protein [Candidatus Falkowbacteria bacterium]